jgi:inorganic phosphate transporter, PiT family
MLLSAMIIVAVSWTCRRRTQRQTDRWFRRLQLVSSAMYSIGHGGNDAQKTMGQRITKLKPVGGFAAETGGAMSLFLATNLGIPVSTTHTITGSIVGVGSAQRARAVRWGVAGNIVAAWVLTIPASALIAAAAWWVGWQLF